MFIQSYIKCTCEALYLINYFLTDKILSRAAQGIEESYNYSKKLRKIYWFNFCHLEIVVKLMNNYIS